MSQLTHPSLSRRSRRALLPALGGLLVAPGLALARNNDKKKKRKKTRVITKTFRSDAPITINDAAGASPYPAIIRVKGFKHGKLLDVDVTLSGLNHGFAGDLDVLLRAPGGRRAIIMSDAGGGTPLTNVTLTLDDQAGPSLPRSSQITSGSFQPTNFTTIEDIDPTGTDANFGFAGGPGTTTDVRLATFKGINPNGDWTLFIFDDDAPTAGTLSGGWKLRIKAKVKARKRNRK